MTIQLVALVHYSANVEPASADVSFAHSPARAHPIREPGTVSTINVPSGDADGGQRQVRVYRPAGKDNSHMPVVYLLHGLPGSDNDPFGAGIADVINSYIASGGRPFVLAVPDGNSSIYSDTEWADSKDSRLKLESFVTGPLIDAIEGSSRRESSKRVIAGFSMGGYGAVNIAEHHPDLYSQVVSIAGYMHIDDDSDVFGGDVNLQNINNPSLHADALKKTRVLLSEPAGDDDPVTTGESQRFKSVLDAAGVTSTLAVSDGGHGWSYVTSQLPPIFNFLNDGWHK